MQSSLNQDSAQGPQDEERTMGILNIFTTPKKECFIAHETKELEGRALPATACAWAEPRAVSVFVVLRTHFEMLPKKQGQVGSFFLGMTLFMRS